LTEGFWQAGYDVSFALDSDPDSCETYALNHKDTDVECASISDLDPADIARRAGRQVDVVIGGPSCQGFSTARKDRWNDPRSSRNRLWRSMLGVVAELKPRAFLMENVPGMVMWKDSNFGARILREFRRLGYTVQQPQILLAADFGVPQRRRRLFIVGIRGGKAFDWPSPTHLGGWRRDTLEHWEQKRVELGLLRHLNVWETISDLPLLEGTSGAPRMEYAGPPSTPIQRQLRGGATVLRQHEAVVLGDAHCQLISHVPQGGTWRDIPPYLLPDRFRGMRRSDSSNLLGRLDPALPAYTITTQFTNVTVGCFAHPFEDRALSVREAARLQTFPDRYRFIGTVSSRAKQIGNAVPPRLAEVFAHAIADQIAPKRARPPLKLLKPAAQLPAPPTTTRTRKRMKAQKRVDTKPETLVREALAELSVTKYEIDVRPLEDLRRTADLVFARERMAIFIDGCFWHGCPDHSRKTKSNTKWWKAKIDANKARDFDTTSRLQTAGWSVVRVWEHEKPDEAARRIVRALQESPVSSAAAG
jgi:DNA (cytosine-5)-methyltransferase 1